MNRTHKISIFVGTPLAALLGAGVISGIPLLMGGLSPEIPTARLVLASLIMGGFFGLVWLWLSTMMYRQERDYDRKMEGRLSSKGSGLAPYTEDEARVALDSITTERRRINARRRILEAEEWKIRRDYPKFFKWYEK